MLRSDNTRSDRIGFETLDSLSRYDLVLAFIPVVFLLSVVLGYLLSVPFRTTLTGASAVGALALLDALFVNPPIRPTQ
ncbi:hypothetical protein BV210_00885 [Halorientalis sp. IM1011]|uniref:hypothetical protein n=1 Tax=Halorientalis sp. IM1011 TaxID=1932360 RepID=UPI00097CCDE8|nr:hypothetical protein [Halorientalis sp. IM1011]AQL44422.1 hypothetical protein BV210_00885 [Halorientalis sp. IM1011]